MPPSIISLLYIDTKNDVTGLLVDVDRRIRVYDTSHSEFQETRCIQAQDVGWSILDLALRYLSLCLYVCTYGWSILDLALRYLSLSLSVCLCVRMAGAY